MTALFMDNTGFSASAKFENNDEEANSDDDILSNTLNLQLKKPKAWNWELTTSKSSPNIAFPRIVLYNDKGDILADARDSNCVFKGDYRGSAQLSETQSLSTLSTKNKSSTSSSIKSMGKRRSSTTNLTEINESLVDLVDHLRTNGIAYKLNSSPHRSRAGSNERKLKRYGNLTSKDTIPENFSQADWNTNETNEVSISNGNCKKLKKLADNVIVPEIPIWVYSEKGLLKRNLNAKEFDHLRQNDEMNFPVEVEFSDEKKNASTSDLRKVEKSLTPVKGVRFDLQKSKSATDVLEREKRKTRRSSNSVPSKFSGSILERMSAFKKYSSSTDSQDVEVVSVAHGPRYFLRTSNAGTLVVCEENFRNRKIRRRPRSISRISEIDENDINCSKEKIVQKFVYPNGEPRTNGGQQNDVDSHLYDQVISKLDSLISKVSLKRGDSTDADIITNSIGCQNLKSKDNQDVKSSKQFLTVPQDPRYLERGQSVASDFKVKRRRKVKELRRCVSAGAVCLSSDDEEYVTVNRCSRNRSKRKTSLKTPKGDQILALNSSYSSIQPLGSSPAATGIIDESSDEILLRFVRRLESFKQQKNLQKDLHQPLNSAEEAIVKVDENRNYQLLEDENNHQGKKDEILTNICNSQRINSENNSEFTKSSIKENVQKTKVCGSVSKDHVKDNKSSENYLTDDIRTKGGSSDDECPLTEAPDYVVPLAANDENRSERNKENFLVDSNMGSNVSRNTSKGLSGRRTQSSGNLYNNKNGEGYYHTSNGNTKEKITKPRNESESVKYHTMDRRDGPDNPLESHPPNLIMPPLSGVTKEDRNKFCGSLPNHLDDDDNVKDINPNYNHAESYIKADRVEYVTVTSNRPQQHQRQMQLSPYNNSTSEKETASTSSESSTFKINQDKPDIQLKLPLTRSNFDPSCDQGYGSERSPEDEVPPLLPHITPSPYLQQQTLIADMNFLNGNPFAYNFITKDCTFTVQIIKGPRGLGLSISGGIDSNAAFPGLIRIKRLFPHQAAWSTGKLQPGDIILEANDVPLTGLTNYEALEVLRTMPSEVVLLVCRPNDEHYKKLSPPTEPPKPPQRTQQQGTQTMPEESYPLEPIPLIQTNFSGEFEIIMVKQQGSLGFTLRKEDESVLGHYVRALVREPATTDGRIKPGDKIVAVNDVPLSPMTHEQAVIFLRQAADTVKLRFYRDEAQTPVTAMSPTTSENKVICGSGKKTFLRPEAINLLSDLAYKKQNTPCDSTDSSLVSSNTSPRRLKRGNKHSSANTSQSEQDGTDSKGSSNVQYIVSSQTTSVCSDSEQSGASQCSFIVQAADNSDTETLSTPDTERPNRPTTLNLSGQSSSNTSVPSRKTKLQFSVPANAYDLNNLDNDALDAPRYTNENAQVENQLPDHDFTSLPCETFLIACKTENDLKDEANFSYKNPMYQSEHVVSQNDDLQENTTKRAGSKSLLKWKGVVFSPDEEEKETPGADSSCTATAGTNSTPGTERHFDLKEFPSNPEGYKIITVELNRGWNSRLGFSLQTDSSTNKTVIRAIYSDSVAARDGRLRLWDQLLMVNEESVENMPTQQVIELLRLLRGSIAITVLRKDPESTNK